MENDIHTLTIKLSKTTIKFIVNNNEKLFEHEIQVNLVLGYYWSKNLPVVEKFLELIETVIKTSIFRVFPHEKLKIRYDLRANDSLENASSIFIEFLEIKVDDTLFEIIGGPIILEGIDKRGNLSKVTSFRRKIKKIVEKEL
ncbi:MAG: hypothetical protein LBT66_04590 [Methanobrevibacter sp.]|jgi:hypothetical protein|nr:hypothetical protein [Candidatus Methanovirga meridionalis]